MGDLGRVPPLEQLGLTMYGQMTAGSWIYIGTQGILQGSELASAKLERVLTNDPAMGVIRHTDAAYDQAAEVATQRGVRVPMAP